MRAVFESHPELIKFILQIILNDKNLTVDSVSFQEDFKNLLGRSTVFDVFGNFSNGDYFDLEIERSDSNVNFDRLNYHESLMNSRILPPGASFNDLPKRYVIFITENDVYGAH